MPLRTLGALLLALAACAWGLAFSGQFPATLGFAFSLMCCGLAWALVPWWMRRAPSDVETPNAPAISSVTDGAPPKESVELKQPAVAEGESAEREPHATTPREHALRFSLDVLVPARTNTPLAKLYSAYHDWCETCGEEPFATREIGMELAALFERTGLEVVEINGTRFVEGARLKTRRAALGRIAKRKAA